MPLSLLKGPTANVSPAREAGPLSIDSPTLSERRRRRQHFHLNLRQYSVEKYFQDGPVELQIPRLRWV